jgi:ATP-dependent Clp protease adaptor protein ClpS
MGKPPLMDQDNDMAHGDELVITKVRPKTDKPPLYKVLLLNDDFTPMDFVILILKKFFTKSDAEATKIMLQVHNEGAGLAGIYTFEVAETKVYSVNEFSRRHKHPLKCTMEKE